MRLKSVKIIYLVILMFIFGIVLGIYYTQKQINKIMARSTAPIKTVTPVKKTNEHKGSMKQLLQPQSEKIQRRVLVPNHPSEYGIVLRELPKNGTSENWETFYSKEHDYHVASDPKMLEAYKKFQKSPEEVKAILDRYDNKIEEYQAILNDNPRDADAKDRLQTMIRTRAFAKVISDKFNEIPYKYRK